MLGFIAFADQVGSRKKTDAFMDAVIKLKSIIDPAAAITRKSMMSWVNLNQKKIHKSIEAGSYTSKFENNLKTLQILSQKPDVIFAMIRIAIADETYCDLEKSLITETILQWDMPAKVVGDIEYICPDIITEPLKTRVN